MSEAAKTTTKAGTGKGETVWVCPVFKDTRTMKDVMPFYNGVFWDDISEEERLKISDFAGAYKRGHCDVGKLPNAFAGSYKDTRLKPLPHFFNASGYIVVSDAFAEVLRGFEWQEGLYPVEVFQGNRKTKPNPDQAFFLLGLNSRKDSFLPEKLEKGARVRPYNTTPVIWRMVGDVNDGDCPLSEGALSGFDLWMEERLEGGIFLSDRLVKALKAAKLTRGMPLKRCRIVMGGA